MSGGERFLQLLAPHDEGYGPKLPISINAQLEFQDIDGNGTTELLFPRKGRHFYCTSGPHRIPKDINMWGADSYRYVWTDPGTPEYIFQAAFDGDYCAELGLYQQSEKAYRKAISDSALKSFTFYGDGCGNPEYWEPDDPQTILAYARFRLLELLVYLKEWNAAQVEWNYLSGTYTQETPGYWYSVLAGVFWDAYQTENDIEKACEAVEKMAAQNSREIFNPLYFGTLNPGPTLDTICPFTSAS